MTGAPHLRVLQGALVEADDAKIIRVTAMVDRLADRGPADALIAPLRARLSQLQPSRPLTFNRLLFTPVDALVVPPSKWRRGALGIPRTALAAFGAVVHAELGAAAAALDAEIATITTGQTDAIAALGARLWPAAAAILAVADAPATWHLASGLPVDDYFPLAHAVAALLGETSAIHRLTKAATTGAPAWPEDLKTVFGALSTRNPNAVAMLTAMLTSTVADSQVMLKVCDDAIAGHADPAIRNAVERGIDFVLGGIENGPPDTADIGQAAAEVARVAGLLATLTGRASHHAAQRGRIEQLRSRLDGTCRAKFAAELNPQLVTPIAAMAGATAEQVGTLERTARDFRRFEIHARQLGGGDQYDRAIAIVATGLKPTPADSRETKIDRVRLMEILRGPEAAEALLNSMR